MERQAVIRWWREEGKFHFEVVVTVRAVLAVILVSGAMSDWVPWEIAGPYTAFYIGTRSVSAGIEGARRGLQMGVDDGVRDRVSQDKRSCEDEEEEEEDAVSYT